MHDPLLVQFTAQTVAALDGKAELVLSKASTSTQRLALVPTESSDSTTVRNSTLPPTYEDVKAEESYEEEVIRDPDKKVASDWHCDQNCRCICHSNQRVLPAELAKKRRASAPSLIARFVRACTLKDCGKKRRRSTGSLTVPSQVVNRAIGIKLLSKGFNHLFILKTCNAVSENSDQIRYAASGNLHALMMLVQTNKATINDTGPDGWSLLHVRSYSLPDYVRRILTFVVSFLLEPSSCCDVADRHGG
jgi:hypothetical protein